MRRELVRPLEELNARIGARAQAPKRAMPDWLQTVYESRGFVFVDYTGQIISAPPDRFGWSGAERNQIDADKSAERITQLIHRGKLLRADGENDHAHR